MYHVRFHLISQKCGGGKRKVNLKIGIDLLNVTKPLRDRPAFGLASPLGAVQHYWRRVVIYSIFASLLVIINSRVVVMGIPVCSIPVCSIPAILVELALENTVSFHHRVYYG